MTMSVCLSVPIKSSYAPHHRCKKEMRPATRFQLQYLAKLAKGRKQKIEDNTGCDPESLQQSI